MSSDQEIPRELQTFQDLLVTVEKPKTALATKKQLKELLTFIGGFEKWPLLNEDCQREVVTYLDYKTRCNLGRCSRSSYDLVEKTPIQVQSLEILDNESMHYSVNKEPFDNVTVRIRFLSRSIELFFSQLGEDTLIQWSRPIPKRLTKQVTRKSCNYYEEAVKFAEKWMKKSNFELEAITIEMAKYPFESSRIKLLPCCRKARICADDVDSFDWWLKKLPEQLDDLQLVVYSEDRKSFTLPSEFLNAPQVMQASEIGFSCRAAFSDEQLLKLNAKLISFDCVDVTDKGINKFIENWVNGKGVNGFKELQLWPTSDRDPETMVAGLDAEEWDETFEYDEWGFVEDFRRFCGRGDFFQIKSRIDPFESLTLAIHHNRVSVYATGRRCEDNGEVYTYYRIP
ncbi:unnamed protein product [Caenorhabditis brenneri]